MTNIFYLKSRYNEVCNPGYGFVENDPRAPGFTQLVWGSTKTFGIGKATSEQDGMLCTYAVGRFKEKGNIPSRYKQNVKKGSFDYGYCDSMGKASSFEKRIYDAKGELYDRFGRSLKSAL